MKIIFSFGLLILSFSCYSQTKKEQIEILANRADSLNLVLNSTRNANNKKEIEYKEQISSLQKRLEDLKNSLTKVKEDLLKKEEEINISNQELKNKLLEITVLKNQINEKDLQIANLKLELNNLKTSLNNIHNDEIGKSDFFQSVTIGTQIWMTENLNIAVFRNGDPIPEAKTPEEWKKAGDNKQPAWCYYNNDQKNQKKFGKLYNWYAVNDPRGLAPKGWHIPSEDDWYILTNYLDSDDYYGTKLQSTTGWPDLIDEVNGGVIGTGNGNNISGFSAFPGGLRDTDGSFRNIGEYGFWWGITDLDTKVAFMLMLGQYSGPRNESDKSSGLSVRCIKY